MNETIQYIIAEFDYQAQEDQVHIIFNNLLNTHFLGTFNDQRRKAFIDR
jgi:hypothetical protein